MNTSKKNFDVVFNDDCDSNSKGFSESYEYCLDYIKTYNGTTKAILPITKVVLLVS